MLGDNVRGWTVSKADAAQSLEVTLLKAAQQRASFSVILAKRGAVGGADLATFVAPVLNLAGAAQQSGEVIVRRSPLIALRTEKTIGVSRADSDAKNAAAEGTESPLGLLPYQTYRFASTPFTVELSARPTTPRVSAELQTVLKISERQRTLESRVRISVRERPIYRLRIAIPLDWKLDRVVAPEPFQWVLGTQGEDRLLNLYFGAGVRQAFDVILSGPLGDYGAVESLAVPRMKVIDVDERPDAIEQSGDIVVQADPGLVVRPEKLVECETELLSRTSGWLAAEQQKLARLALRYRSPDYSATLRLSRRKPVVHCDTVTNVRVTRHTVEDTILLDFNIQEAGVREVVFVLPASMREARISAPLLRQKTLEPLGDAAGLRVRLALQDEVLNSFRVLVEHDRLLTSEKFSAPIPKIETGQTGHRYVTLESAGRDEVLVDTSEGVDPLGQEQSDWRMLSGLLGRGLTQAYLVRAAANEPSLVLRTQDRAAVETTGARIGLAKTTLVIDPNGAYRGAQLYRVDNSLEQYLEIALPAGARLWTAHVAGEPVKPAAATTAGEVRIPLVKTAAGDADYAVALKYSGQLGRLGTVDRVKFPFIRTLNINVELSQVELHVPATHRWFNFGGTMRVVSSEGDLTAGQLAYNTKQIGLALQSIRSDDRYARARALSNVKVLQDEAEALKQSARSYRQNEDLQKQLESNTLSVLSIDNEHNREANRGERKIVIDNRGRLNQQFSTQSNQRSGDVVQGAGRNFEGQTAPAQTPGLGGEDRGQALSKEWLYKNNLGGNGDKSFVGSTTQSKTSPERPRGPGFQADFRKFAKPQGREGDDRPAPSRLSSGEQSNKNLERYQERLERQQMQLPHSSLAGGGGLPAANEPSGSDDDTDNRSGGPFRANLGGNDFDSTPPNQPVFARGGQAPAALASLDVQLQPRGIKYLLTTPRGDVQVTVQAVSRSFAGRVLRLLLILFVATIVLALANRVMNKRRAVAT